MFQTSLETVIYWPDHLFRLAFDVLDTCFSWYLTLMVVVLLALPLIYSALALPGALLAWHLIYVNYIAVGFGLSVTWKLIPECSFDCHGVYVRATCLAHLCPSKTCQQASWISSGSNISQRASNWFCQGTATPRKWGCNRSPSPVRSLLLSLLSSNDSENVQTNGINWENTHITGISLHSCHLWVSTTPLRGLEKHEWCF